MNVHSSGGYFMWPPSAYKQANRESLPYPPYGTLNYFDQTADAVLNRIYSYRGTAVLPSRTGPVNDVLYSAAGNQADEAYYKNGIIAYAFETGADKRLADGSSIPVGFQPPFARCRSAATRTSPTRATTRRWSSPTATTRCWGRRSTTPTTRRRRALRRPARRCPTPPSACASRPARPSTIRYTTDGSTPTDASPEWKPNRPRERPDPVELGANTTLKWFATDFKGNRSAVQSKAFVVDMVGPTVAFTSPAADGATFTQGRPVALHVHLRRRELGRGELRRLARARAPTSTRATPGTFTYSVTARDAAGNETVVTRGYTVIPATNVDTPILGNVPATLSLTLGQAASFGNFTPGVARAYDSSVGATVTSSAGNATAERRRTRARATSVI